MILNGLLCLCYVFLLCVSRFFCCTLYSLMTDYYTCVVCCFFVHYLMFVVCGGLFDRVYVILLCFIIIFIITLCIMWEFSIENWVTLSTCNFGFVVRFRCICMYQFFYEIYIMLGGNVLYFFSILKTWHSCYYQN